jgi:Mrp family chromosome partitioning ATPase
MDKETSRPAEEQSCSSCDKSDCSAKTKQPGESDRDFESRQTIHSRMCRIGHKILVLSGKGGVGKSTVAVNIASTLAAAGKRVGLMDVDIHGPSIPKLLSIDSVPMGGPDKSILPAEAASGLKVMSIGFMLPGRDDAVIWRGPMKFNVIKQFLSDVEWGELDYLVVDSPPGTGDEPLAVAQLIGSVDGAVIVTTPQELAVDDVRRSINFCRKVDVPILGVIENMSGFVCPHCGAESPIFKRGGGETMAGQMQVPYLGAIPIDPDIVQASDAGTPFIQRFSESRAAEAFQEVIRPLLDLPERKKA